MIKVISRPFLGKEKYKDLRLCYINSISETYYDLTPESKAWERTPPTPAIIRGRRSYMRSLQKCLFRSSGAMIGTMLLMSIMQRNRTMITTKVMNVGNILLLRCHFMFDTTGMMSSCPGTMLTTIHRFV